MLKLRTLAELDGLGAQRVRRQRAALALDLGGADRAHHQEGRLGLGGYISAFLTIRLTVA